MSTKKIEINEKVAIVRFSIHGIDGFQTVNALGASREKRIRTALNEMARSLDAMKNTVVVGGEDSPDRILLIRAKYVVDRIIESVTPEGEFNGVQITNPVVKLLTTEQFFEEADAVYRDNMKLFLESMDSIKENKRKAEHAKQIAPKEQRSLPPIPHMYVCSGGFLGDVKHHVVVSLSKFEGAPVAFEDFARPVRNMFYAQLYMHKNFMLSDYLRIKDEKQRAQLKHRLTKIDEFIDGVEQIQARHLTSLLSFGLEDRLLSEELNGSSTDERLSKVTQFLSFQAEHIVGEIIRSKLDISLPQ